jgi:16S rRNA (guanine(966)-N(2))-methyltransferase RsmD
VIGGEFRSRLLRSLPGLDVRPTPDRLREALFNVLAPRIEGVTFIDAFAGTGAVGIEALSRGAARAIFLEKTRAAAQVIRENLRALAIEDRADVRQGTVTGMLPMFRGDIVFVDPPYRLEGEYDATFRVLAAMPPALVIMQHASRFDPGDEHDAVKRVRVLKQGDNSLSFYEPKTPISTRTDGSA